jgi:cyclic dehypoxanthinyl futalosine synthase
MAHRSCFRADCTLISAIDYYLELLRKIKERYTINIHGFSPPEVMYLARRHALTVRETLML